MNDGEMNDREWLYRIMLQAYPPAFRGTFGREMLLVYRAQRRDGVVDTRYWLASIADAAATAPRLWMDELRDGFHSAEGTMKTMGIISALAGLLEIANASVELRASAFGGRDLLSQTVLVFVIATASLLVVAGVALLFGGHAARRLAGIGAAACIGAFLLMLATRPMMSVAATGLGIAFPLVLWLSLYVSQRRAARGLVA